MSSACSGLWKDGKIAPRVTETFAFDGRRQGDRQDGRTRQAIGKLVVTL